MARPTKDQYLKPIKNKVIKLDGALARIKEGCQREPAKLADIGLSIGEAQAIFVDMNAHLKQYALVDDDDTILAQMEASLNDIEKYLKEEIVNVPMIGMNTGMLTVCSEILKDNLGLTQVAPEPKAARRTT